MDRKTGFARLPGRSNLVNLVILSVLFLCGVPSKAQTPTSSIDEKSQKIIDAAVAALGGQAYLNVQTIFGKGYFSDFKDGAPQVPSKFVDYLVYPNRERTEFTQSGIKTIQTNDGNTGWMFDGAVKKISDQGPAQIEEFKRTMRASVENILRGWWRNEGGTVKYVGRREAGLAKRNETIRLTYPDGFWIEYEFGAKDGLPAKVIYKRMRKDMDLAEMVETTEEDYLRSYVNIEGVNVPWVIDHFVNGKQTSRINYDQVQFNQKFTDALFAKPDNVKAIK
ncbi:MAG TPA: hypothetical protein VJ749_11690 [Pyrinomonadaceae bacterium]|nr:hypothetical protein [Pyrinomonadaceae bacterium]